MCEWLIWEMHSVLWKMFYVCAMIGYLLLLSLACTLTYEHKFGSGGIKQT